MNCWEFMQCGREKGGHAADAYGICPVWPHNGTQCARVVGTLCRSGKPGSAPSRFRDCRQCRFFTSPYFGQRPLTKTCWEFMKCGREQGGFAALKLGVCPAWPDHGFECYRVAGTMCDGTTQGSFARKLADCLQCDYYNSEFARKRAGSVK